MTTSSSSYTTIIPRSDSWAPIPQSSITHTDSREDQRSSERTTSRSYRKTTFAESQYQSAPSYISQAAYNPFSAIGNYTTVAAPSSYQQVLQHQAYPQQQCYLPRQLQDTHTSWSASSTPIYSTNFNHSHERSWSMYLDTDSSMGYSAASPMNGLKRQRSHQRTPSASTINSNGPSSPYNNSVVNHNTSYPQIANTDFDPTAPQTFSKDLSTTNPAFLSAYYTPRQSLADWDSSMKGFALNTSNNNNIISNLDDISPGSTRHSMTTSDSADSPMTPHEEVESKPEKAVAAFRTLNPQVQLARTESAAYQDELYNPALFRANPTSGTVSKSSKSTSPASARNMLVHQRLETANQARSSSPSSIARDRSPFREGSQLAPADSWSSPRVSMMTEANRRRKAKEEREEAEYALHRPQLQREQTKTISPKDALLDYTEGEQPSLFQDTVPVGYAKHFGTGQDNSALTGGYLDQNNSTSFTLPPGSQSSMANFRATSADTHNNAHSNNGTSFNNNNNTTTFSFTPPALPATSTAAAVQNPYLNNYQQLSQLTPSYNAGNVDPTPDFPAHLTSMESSISEGPPVSSQESANTTLQRPAETRAHTGTYTCTYHGCTQRFESPANLQKHKREFHRSQQHNRDSLSVEKSSASPRSTASPGPQAGSGLTSAQILARNSQAGPHKCTRINPSTGKPCNTIFSRPYDLTRHEDTIHNGRKQKVRCPYCREEKTFSRNDALTRHMRVVHPDVENFGKRGRRGD